jgi:hypothetical protein
MPQLGTLLSDQQMSDGIVRADVVFDEISDDSSCEIILAYEVHDQSMLTAGLGAFRVLFYEDSIAGKARIEEGLQNHLKAILQRR